VRRREGTRRPGTVRTLQLDELRDIEIYFEKCTMKKGNYGQMKRREANMLTANMENKKRIVVVRDPSPLSRVPGDDHAEAPSAHFHILISPSI
jgi:hypothetical protein